MPGLYGFTANASNVSVTNTTGLYQLNSNVNILNSAQTLNNLLANSSSIGFYLTNTNQNVTGIVLGSGVTPGTYGDGLDVPRITVGADGRVTSVVNIPINPAGIYSNANVAAYLPVNSSNVAGNYFFGNGSLLTGISVSSNIFLIGDVLGTGNTGNNIVTSLSNIGVTPGTYGTVATIPVVTVGANGRVLSMSSVGTSFGNVIANFNPAVQFSVATSGNNQTFSNSTIGVYTSSSQISVFHNGVLIPWSDYTLAGPNITINEYLTAGDTINIAPQIIAIDANSTYSNTNVAAYLTTATITTTGNITANYITGNGSNLTNLPIQPGTYSNTNVAAYLTTATITTTGNITGANLTTAGNVTGTYIKGNGSQLTGLPSSTVTLTGNVTGSGQTGTNINTTIAATGVVPGGYGSDTIIPHITVGLDGRITQISTNAISGGGSYGNSNVAAYLPTYTGSMPNLTSVNTSGNITANAGGYFTGDGSKLTNLPVQAGTYSNTNVAAYLTTATITTSGNVQGAYVLGDGSKLTNLPVQAGTYSNTNVAAYLTTATISTTGNITGGNLTATSYVIGDGSKLTNLPVQAGTYSNTNVTALLSSNTVSTIATTGNITAGGNIITPGTFYGNLIAANILVANIGIQAYSTYQTTTTPTYAMGVLWYDNVADALAYYNGVTNNTIHIGQETQFQAYNGTGSTITQGTPVYITGGSTGTFPNIAPAQANTLTTTVVAGVANQNIPASTYGYVVTEGTVANVSMGTFSTGDTLYLSPYSAGQVQKTVPVTGYVAIVGVVTYNNSPNGRFLVRITNPTNNQTFGNISVTSNITTGNISSTNGYFWANGTAYSTGSTSTYSNTNVAAYLTTATISTTGNITAANLITAGNVSGNYIIGNGSKLTNLPVQAGTYSNANVSAYLPTYSGTMQANSYVATRNNITDSTTTGAYSLGALTQADTGVMAALQTNTNGYAYLGLQNTNSGTQATTDVAFYNDTANLGVYMDVGINSTGYTGTGSLNKANTGYVYTGNADLSIGTYYNNPIHFVVNNGATDAMTIATNNTVLVSNIASTSGYFWANGAAYNGFTGNLLGSTLTDSTNGRILANAYPQSNVTQISTYTQGVVVTTTPTYTSGNLNSANQAVSFIGSGNVNLLTSYAAGTRTTTSLFGYLGVTATSANTTMNTNDRIRGMTGGMDLNLNGKNWGALSSASNTLTPILVNGQTLNVYGTGQMGQVGGIGTAVTLTPVGGSISAQYATGIFPSITYASTGAGYTASNIAYARLYTGAIAGAANLTIGNAIALHTFTNWATGNVTLVPNAYTVLNEDTRSIIQTAGNIVATTTSNVILGSGQMVSYRDKIQALGTTSGSITLDGTVAPSWTITLNGTLTLSNSTFTNYASGSSVTLIVTQDGTGSRTLSTTQIKWAGGSNTLSTAAGSIDIINFYYDGTTWYGSLVKGYV